MDAPIAECVQETALNGHSVFVSERSEVASISADTSNQNKNKIILEDNDVISQWEIVRKKHNLTQDDVVAKFLLSV